MATILDKTTKEEYLALVQAFPVVSIRDEAHLAATLTIIDRLLDQPQRSPAEDAYLHTLTDLIETYENAHIIIPPTSGVEALRHLIAENGLTQADLAPLLGTPSIVSEVLSGKRRLALTHITRLAERFGLPADVFIDKR